MRSLIYILLLSVSFECAAQQILVSLFNSVPVKGLTISLYEGNYIITGNQENLEGLQKGKIFYITLYNKSMLVHNLNGPVGCFDEIEIQSKTDSGKFMISIIDPKVEGRIYTGSLKLKIDYRRVMLMNEINIEKYISGVVEAETGINARPEFYKAQALLCRTYLFNHLNRHESEGFNLCDEVHCQAYKGISTNFIFKSTHLTNNKVIVDSDKNLITASFHANCGGITESSLNTWLKPESYLIPVKDPYCLVSGGAHWEKKISLNEWKKYLITHGVKTTALPAAALELKNTGRQNYYRVNKDSILMRQIRADWNLKSSFFQVIVKNNMVLLKGSGYGHGVGLCQEGAIKMASKGFTYEEIIKFYFKGVKIENLK